VQRIRDFLERAGLVRAGDTPRFEPLAGGVSSDIWLVRTGSSEFCVKQALPQLRVAAEWRADISRSANEVRWLTQVGRLDADLVPLVPRVLASDASIAAFAMEYLSPDRYELWKAQLARGDVNTRTAAAVGRRLAAMHAAFANSPTAAADFDTGALFHALRIEPYLLATARAHPDLAPILEALATRTETTTLTVIHGDISPKNILIGLSRRSGTAVKADGPIFLDAECAWFGDPAFDLAFCLNHLLLKTLWVPTVARELLASFDALVDAYLGGVGWEPAKVLEQRAAQLLPALFLARVDGKSPVEYLTDEAPKNTVRQFARSMLQQPRDTLRDVRQAWGVRANIGARSSAAGSRDRIEKVIGRRVWDSRGRPTVEAEIVLASGARGRAIAPAGASTGINEAVDLRDGGQAFDGFGVDRAVRHIALEIANALRGLPVDDQEAIDRTLVELDGTPNKSRLGGNAIVAVSMAAIHAAAAVREMPLWRHLAGGAEPTLPLPMVQIFGGGAHAGRRVDIQDFLVVPIGASTFDEAIAVAVQIYGAAGRLMADRGGLRGVADEGGWWPEFSSSRDALDALVLAIERAGLKPGAGLRDAPPVTHYPLDNALALEAGDTLRLTCEWENDTDEALGFPNEMCDSMLVYYPARPEGFIICGE
jgi:aminoglycoside phosphotransferase (APT) family kinase protein